MPKPNKYAGNGSLKPEGTTEGAYVMHKGRMVPNFQATDSAIERGINAYKAFKGNTMVKTISRIMLYILVVAMCGALLFALSGCQVNVVNVVHSDIGVGTSSTVQALVE